MLFVRINTDVGICTNEDDCVCVFVTNKLGPYAL